MATVIKLTRPNPSQPWGLRIHGGRDFHQPIIVLKVTAGTLAASSGLTPGDQIASINGRDASSMSHKEAENLIKNAGNEVSIGVYKTTTSTWKPAVTPLGAPNEQGEVTKTSLKKQGQPHATVQTKSGSVLVNKQFNTPINMYSEQSIAEALSGQAEVLAGGAIGVNFKKNEKKYNYENSEVYKMLQEVENDAPSGGDDYASAASTGGMASPGRTSASFVTNQSSPYSNVLNRQQQQQFAPAQAAQPPQQQQQVQLQPIVPQQPQPQQQQFAPQQQQQQQQQSLASLGNQVTQQVTAPVTSAAAPAPSGAGGGSNPNICADCERLIVGVFVRIKDKNLHVDCFICSTCGQSLKNVGYFNINNKLYCDIHAKTVARQNPPGPGLEPVTTVPKTPQLPLTPAAAFGPPKPFSYTGAAAPSAPSAPSAAPAPLSSAATPLGLQIGSPLADSYASKIAPLPYHHSPSGQGITHVTAPKSPQQQQQQFTQQQQQQIIQQSSSSSYQESTFKSSSSSFEQSSSSGSKVTWPPADIVPSPLPSSAGGSNKPKFVQKHVPYQPVSSLLQPAAAPSSQPKFSPVQPPQQQQQFSPFQQSAPQQQQQQIQFSPIIPQQQQPQQPQQQQQQFAPPAPAPAAAPSQFTPAPQQPYVPPPQASKPLPSFPIAPPPGPAAINASSKNTTTSSTLASRIGRGILTQPSGGPRVAVCGGCQKQIRGPFVTAGLKFYCPEHFKCANGTCKRDLMDVGFVEEGSALYCEFCWEAHIAPPCGKCGKRIKYECLKAIGRDFHPQCFTCKHCNRAFGKDPFFLEDGEPFCQADWNEMFTTKCHGCGFPIEAGDRWVEAMNNNYHSQCFNCSACKKNLEGQSFFAKAGRPFCKSHAR